MKGPLFSIITINLNNEKGLLKTLQSISEQTCNKYELIVIDGGSTDNSLEICNKYQGIIAKLVSEKDHGIADAFNKGTFMSTGKIITYLNSGDVYLHKNVLQMVKRAYEKYGPWKWAYGLKKHVDANGNLFPSRSFERVAYNLRQFSLGKIVICHQAVFFDNDLVKKFGGYDERYQFNGMDYDLLLKFALSSEPFTLKEEIVIFDTTGVGSGNLYKLLLAKHAVRCELLKYGNIRQIYDKLRAHLMYGKSRARSLVKTVLMSNTITRRYLIDNSQVGKH